MVNLSRTALRGLAGVAALASLTVAALPSAQANQASGANTPTAPSADVPAQVVGTPPPGDGVTAKSVTSDVRRYSKIYTSGIVTPSKCKEVNVSLRTLAGVKSYATQLWNCNYWGWAAPLRAAGAAYKVKPQLIVHTGSTIVTYCGTLSNPTGYYCSGHNGAIYIPAQQIINQWASNPTMARAWLSQMLSHEYGHHVQYLTGILNASWQRQYALTTNAAKLEESRRRELQASCFGAAYLGADKRYYPMSGGLMVAFNQLVTGMGDQPGGVRDHGAPKNHAYWSTLGFNAKHTYTTPANCNTFNANAKYVS
jgi:hypothetical protein